MCLQSGQSASSHVLAECERAGSGGAFQRHFGHAVQHAMAEPPASRLSYPFHPHLDLMAAIGLVGGLPVGFCGGTVYIVYTVYIVVLGPLLFRHAQYVTECDALLQRCHNCQTGSTARFNGPLKRTR